MAVILVLASMSARSGRAAIDGSDALAQQLFGRGVDAARHNNWINAREAFEKAYRLTPKLVVLVNLAGAQARTGLLVEALHNYRRVLETSTSPATAEYRDAATAILPSLEARIPRIRLRAAGLGPLDVVAIDGTEVPRSALDSPYLINPGAHTLTIKRDGVQRARIDFSVAEGEFHDISLPAAVFTLSPAPQARDLDVILSPAAAPPTQPSRRRWWRSVWFWTATGGIVAASTLALVLVAQRPQSYSGNVGPGIVNVP